MLEYSMKTLYQNTNVYNYKRELDCLVKIRRTIFRGFGCFLVTPSNPTPA